LELSGPPISASLSSAIAMAMNVDPARVLVEDVYLAPVRRLLASVYIVRYTLLGVSVVDVCGDYEDRCGLDCGLEDCNVNVSAVDGAAVLSLYKPESTSADNGVGAWLYIAVGVPVFTFVVVMLSAFKLRRSRRRRLGGSARMGFMNGRAYAR
jgi:hypothetical protein